MGGKEEDKSGFEIIERPKEKRGGKKTQNAEKAKKSKVQRENLFLQQGFQSSGDCFHSLSQLITKCDSLREPRLALLRATCWLRLWAVGLALLLQGEGVRLRVEGGQGGEWPGDRPCSRACGTKKSQPGPWAWASGTWDLGSCLHLCVVGTCAHFG